MRYVDKTTSTKPTFAQYGLIGLAFVLLVIYTIILVVGLINYEPLDLNKDGKVTLTDLVIAKQLEHDIVERLTGGTE